MAREFETGACAAVAASWGHRYAAVMVLAVSAAVGSTGLAIVGYAAGALFISRQADLGRRRRGLVLGYGLGMAGAAVVIVAAVVRSLPVLAAGSIVLGAANSAVYLTRYAAAAGQAGKGRAIGAVLSATAVGAVSSSLLLGPSGGLAAAVGLPPLTGLYLIAIMAFGVSALLLGFASAPSVPWLGQVSAVLTRDPGRPPADAGQRWRSLAGGRTMTAFAALAVTNMIMVGTMVVAPVRMMGSGAALPMIGTVVALHVAGMFAPSPVTGALADRVGPRAVVLGGAVLYVADNVVAAVAGVPGTGAMVGYLIVLGVAWNCGVVGGSAFLMRVVKAVPGVAGSYAEGMGEVAMGVAAAVAAPLASLVVALADFSVYALCCAALAAAMIIGFTVVPGYADLTERSRR